MPIRKVIRRAAGVFRKKTKAVARPMPKMGKASPMGESRGRRIGRKIGAHLRRNKRLYAVGGGAATLGYIGGRRSERKRRRS